MATTVRVQYRRQWQDIPYWSQVVELTIEGGSIEEVARTATPENLRQLAKVYKEMEMTGDQLIVDALEKPHPRDTATAAGGVSQTRPQPTPAPQRTPTPPPRPPVGGRR